MFQEPLDYVPIWLVLAALCLFTGLMLEGGYRLGRWRHARTEEEKATPVGAMVGSILGLFAFILAFTFGLAANRFEERRQAVLEEANAVGTTYLRSKLLSDPQKSTSARLLREYVDVRVTGIQEGKIQDLLTRSQDLHEKLWESAVQAAEKDRSPITGLYIQSLNQMIDLHATRIHVGLRSRIPLPIWITLFAFALLTMASVGYQAGLSPTRRSPAMLALVLAFTGILVLIADLDRPREGFLTVGQQPMIDLQTTMKTEGN